MQEKEQNISPVKQRILQFVDELGISKREFYAKTNISRGTLESKTGITEDTLAKFTQTFPDISLEWLLLGNGEQKKQKISPQGEKIGEEGSYESNNKAIPYAEATQTGLKRIPLVSPMAAAGFGSADFSILKEDVKEYYVIPKFKYCKVDFMIEVTGLSMHPHFNPGDVIACSILHNSQFIQWNKCHVIATREQGILVKRLMPGDNEGCLKAVSDNKEYPPFNIPLEEITGIALVVGSVGPE